MSQYRNSRPSEYGWRSTEIPSWLRFLGRNFAVLAYLTGAVVGMFLFYWQFQPSEDRSLLAMSLVGEDQGLSAYLQKPVIDRMVINRFPQSRAPIRIGIIAGHKNSDSGAVCDDGFTEAELNLNLAQMVIFNLREAGINAELMDEFDERFGTYFGTAVISIHADSCGYVNDLATGFKLASSSYTESTALEMCITNEYAATTQLPYHANTITEHMTDYHVFRKLMPGVDAVIIEVGFMFLDRELLTTHAPIPAKAISDGIQCFLQLP